MKKMSFKNLIARIREALPKYNRASQQPQPIQQPSDTLQPQQPKYLIGVSYTQKENLEKLCSLLGRLEFNTAGIQLPADYKLKRTCAVTTYFFDELETYLAQRGVDVIPLEDQSEACVRQGLILAMNTREQGGSVEELKIKAMIYAAETYKNRGSAPECMAGSLYFAQINTIAAEILAKNPKLEDVLGLFKQSNEKIQGHMLRKIQQTSPDVVLVTTMNAIEMIRSLPDYTCLLHYTAKDEQMIANSFRDIVSQK